MGGTRWRRFRARHERAFRLGAGAMLALLSVLVVAVFAGVLIALALRAFNRSATS